MGKERYLNTKFWDDNYIVDKDPIEKLLFIYLLTNPLTNIIGIYEIALKRIAFDTGIDKEMVLKILKRFEEDNKMKYFNGYIALKNFTKHQKNNPSINKGIENIIPEIPIELLEWVNIDLERFEIPEDIKQEITEYRQTVTACTQTATYLNTNININTNRNRNRNIKNVTSNVTPVTKIFNHWISKNIYNHRKNVYQSQIKTALKKYSEDEILTAITNYEIILHGKEYFWSYKWTLGDFLKKGIDKFSDLQIAKDNYKNNNNNSKKSQEDILKEWNNEKE